MAAAAAAKKRKTVVALPTPEVLPVAAYEQEHEGDYKPPSAYIRMPVRDPEAESPDLEYDLQLDDEYWLNNHPRWGPAGNPRERLTPDVMEVRRRRCTRARPT